MLTWNLFHGRAVPAAGRPLAAEFAAALAGWSWDVALLQEVPPWWPAPLAEATGARARMALTSRNSLLGARRAIASRNPDLLAANGGGCNAILVRGAAIREHRVRELTKRPERRVVHGVALDGAVHRPVHGGALEGAVHHPVRGVALEGAVHHPVHGGALGGAGWVVNVHGSTHPPEQSRADLLTAAATALGWAAGEPLVFGGDLNVTQPAAPGLRHVAGHHVDHVLTEGRPADGSAELLDAGALSDHRPLRVRLERPPAARPPSP